MLVCQQMNLRCFYDSVLELSGLEQTVECALDLRAQRILKTALELADGQDFRSFGEQFGSSGQEYILGTENNQLLRELKTAIALKQRLG